jgi:uncharacterized protein
MKKNIKTIFIPGNGGDGNTSYSWFPYVKGELERLKIQVISPIFPDGILARAEYWLPFIESLNADENTILIGHSSGSIAAMKYAENHEILGSILVSAYYTDLGLESERVSNYFNETFNWEKIRNNQKFIIQFNSTNDQFIPIAEARFVHKKLGTNYYELSEGHFQQPVFSKLIEAIKKYL